MAVIGTQVLPNRAKVEKAVYLTEEVIFWNMLLKGELIKQRILCCRELAHHGRIPSSTNDKGIIHHQCVFQQNHLKAEVAEDKTRAKIQSGYTNLPARKQPGRSWSRQILHYDYSL